MKKLPWFDRQSRTGERPEPNGPAPSKRSRTPQQDFELKMWNVPAILTAAPEMYRVLQRNLNDLDLIDRICDCAGFPRFSLMRKEIEDVLEKARMV